MYMYIYTYIYIYIYMYIYCTRFTNSAEATGGSVGQRLGAIRICKGCLELLGVSWEALGPWGPRVVLGCSWTAAGVLGGPWGVLGGPLGCL